MMRSHTNSFDAQSFKNFTTTSTTSQTIAT